MINAQIVIPACLAGIQARATTGFMCGWIPANSMPE
jgi:hypothetical protein